MKRPILYIAIHATISSMLALFIFTLVNSVGWLDAPYRLGRDTTLVHAFTPNIPTEREFARQLSRFLRTLPDNGIVIAEGYGSVGLLVHDPTGRFAEHALVEGAYFTKDDFSGETGRVLVTEDGYYKDAMGDAGAIRLAGTEKAVIGVIGRDHPLHTAEHPVVQSFYDAYTLEGSYAIEADAEAVASIIGFFRENEYICEIDKNESKSLIAIARNYLENPACLVIASSALFSYIGLYLFMAHEYRRGARVRAIHSLSGGSRFAIFARGMRSFAALAALGSAVGGATLSFYGRNATGRGLGGTLIAVYIISVAAATILAAAVYALAALSRGYGPTNGALRWRV